MMKKIGALLVFVFIISFSIADMDYNPSISIKNGEPDEPIILKLIDTSTGLKFKTISMNLDSTGNGLSSIETNIEEILIYVYHVYNLSSFTDIENIKKTDVAGPFPSNEAMIIDLKNLAAESEPVNPEPTDINSLINDTLNDTFQGNVTEEINEENVTEDSPVTGAVIDEKKPLNISPIFYYIGIGVVLMAVILFFILKKGKGQKWGNEDDREIRAMEEKVKKVGEEIKHIQDKKRRMSEAQLKLADEERELRELEGNN